MTTTKFEAPITQITTTWNKRGVAYRIRYGTTGKWFPLPRAQAEKYLTHRTGYVFVETQTGACEF